MTERHLTKLKGIQIRKTVHLTITYSMEQTHLRTETTNKQLEIARCRMMGRQNPVRQVLIRVELKN